MTDPNEDLPEVPAEDATLPSTESTYVNPALSMIYDGPLSYEVDAATYPGIYRGMNIIIEDSYGPQAQPILTGLLIPAFWSSLVPEINGFVAGLSDEKAAPEDKEIVDNMPDAAENLYVSSILDSELWSFVVGEETVQRAIANRSRAGVISFVFMNELFDGWGGPYDADHVPTWIEDPSKPAGGFVNAGPLE